MRLLSMFIACVLVLALHEPEHIKQVFVRGAEFIPQYGTEKPDEALPVKDFYIDVYPVTNKDFQEFVQAKPEWQFGKPLALLVDQNYLRHWVEGKNKVRLPSAAVLHSPVTNISWFAANDYCEWRGARLPTVLEWEYAAAASHEKPNASRDPEFVQQLLDWYGRPTKTLNSVGKGVPNYWGIYDMHGLVWEWTSDFNSVFVAGDNRRDSEQLKNLFCGLGSASSSDRANYAAYMRYALRNSLKANYTMETLGFRCARDAKS